MAASPISGPTLLGLWIKVKEVCNARIIELGVEVLVCYVGTRQLSVVNYNL